MRKSKFRFRIKGLLLFVPLAVTSISMLNEHAVSFAEETAYGVIRDIAIDGLSSISRNELLHLLDLNAGDRVDPERITGGIKRAFLKGIFEDIQVYEEKLEGGAAGSVVRVFVKERDRIRKISVSGNDFFSARSIRDFFLLKEGGLMRYGLVEEAIAHLKRSMAEKGFPGSEAAVEVARAKEPYRVDLHVRVKEGEPVRIQKMRILGPEDEVRSLMKLSEGSIYDQFRLREDIERIRRHYREDGYIRTAAGAYRFRDGVLELVVTPGIRLEISFEGNDAVSDKDLMREMPFFDADDFRDDLVEEASAKIASLYHSAGFPFVQIAPVVERAGEVIVLHFFIHEREKVRVGAIRFSGVTLPEKNLKEILSLKEGGIYNPDSVFFDRETLEEFYNALGYLIVEVQEPEVTIKDSTADILFTVKEGGKTVVKAVKVSGAQSLPAEEVGKVAGIRPGDPYNEVDVYDARYRIIDLYFEKGFVNVNVDTKRDVEDGGARITFEINEGTPVSFGKTIIAGNERTKTVVIERELLHAEGRPFNQGLLMKERQKLYKLGLFTGVTVEPLDKYDSRRDVLVRIDEGDAGAVEFGIGYGDFEKYRGFFDIGYRNLFGMNRQGSFRLELSSLERRFIINYYDPWFLNRHTPFRTLLLHENRTEKNIDTGEVLYRLRRYSATTGFEKRLSEIVKAELYYEFSLVDTFDVKPDVILTKEDTGTLAISSIRAGIIYDTRDNPFEPTRGILAGAGIKVATAALFSEADFAKVSLNFNCYRALSERFVFAVSFRGGVARGFGATEELPLVERFFLGGRNTVRGYNQDTLGPKGTNGNPTGGNAFLMGNLELRTSLGKGIGVVAFLDGGNVWVRAGEMDLSLRYTAGLGLRYSTPVGPLRVDYGHKLNREPGESSGEIHFSIGHAF